MVAPEALKNWRESQDPKLTLGEAGERAGVTASTWFAWEAGDKSPTVDRAEDLEKLTDGAVTMAMWAEFTRTRRTERETDRDSKKGAA